MTSNEGTHFSCQTNWKIVLHFGCIILENVVQENGTAFSKGAAFKGAWVFVTIVTTILTAA
jgi:hypothetical protein